jgi:biotin carboxyl carrier protein
LAGFRVTREAGKVGRSRLCVRSDDETTDLEIEISGTQLIARSARASHTFERRGADLVLLGDRVQRVSVVCQGREVWVACDEGDGAFTVELAVEAALQAASEAGGKGTLTAELPGIVVACGVAPGDAVRKGQVVATLESMKLQFDLQAPFDGVVGAAPVSVGQTVSRGAVIVIITANP